MSDPAQNDSGGAFIAPHSLIVPSGGTPISAQTLVLQVNQPSPERKSWFTLLRVVNLSMLATAITGGCWLLWAYLDLRAKVDVLPDRIRANVLSELRHVEEKHEKQADELALYKSALDLEKYMYEVSCIGDHATVVSVYLSQVEGMRPKQFPDETLRQVYRMLVTSMLLSSRYSVLKDDELGRVERIFRKDPAACGSSSLFDVGVLYLMNGNTEHGRNCIFAAFDSATNTRSGVDYLDAKKKCYSALVLLEMTRNKSGTPIERADVAWAYLRTLESKSLLHTAQVLAYLSSPMGQTLAQELSVRSGNDVSEVLSLFKARLLKSTFGLKGDGSLMEHEYKSTTMPPEAGVVLPGKEKPKEKAPEC